MVITMNKIEEIFLTPKFLRKLRIAELERLTKTETKYLIQTKISRNKNNSFLKHELF